MGVEAKHSYRFGYLKSEQWQTVRIEALAREKGKCQICQEFSISNDAHHVEYPESIWETKENHLAILCRPCHEFVHSILEIHGVKNHTRIQFNGICTALVKWKTDNRNDGTLIEKGIEIMEIENMERSGLVRCRKCQRFVHRVIDHLFFAKSGGPKEKFKVRLCEDCRDKAEKFVEENYKPDDKWYKVFSAWKKFKS